MTISGIVSVFAGWLVYGAMLTVAAGIFVVLLYAVLRAMRWIWEHRPF